jgi:hypothetical protein
MDLIPFETFIRLRLRQFDPDAPVDWQESACHEFLDSYWFEDAVRGAAFLRHEDDPQRLGGICLDFRYLPPEFAETILSAVRTPLRPGMSVEHVTQLLGAPSKTQSFVPGYVLHDFDCGPDNHYLVRCYFKDGLHAVDIIRKDLLPKQGNDT